MAKDIDVGTFVVEPKVKLPDGLKRTIASMRGLGSIFGRGLGAVEGTLEMPAMKRLTTTISRHAAALSAVVGFAVGAWRGGQGMGAARNILGTLSGAVDDIIFKQALPGIKEHMIQPLIEAVRGLKDYQGGLFEKVQMLGLVPQWATLQGKLFAIQGASQAEKWLGEVAGGIKQLERTFPGFIQAGFIRGTPAFQTADAARRAEVARLSAEAAAKRAAEEARQAEEAQWGAWRQSITPELVGSNYRKIVDALWPPEKGGVNLSGIPFNEDWIAYTLRESISGQGITGTGLYVDEPGSPRRQLVLNVLARELGVPEKFWAFAHGGAGVATSPTGVLVGEAGPEWVQVAPLRGGYLSYQQDLMAQLRYSDMSVDEIYRAVGG